MSARSPIGSAVATTRGDDGTTGLLFGGPRIAKDDPRAEAYGTLDEAVAALGVARAATPEVLVVATGDLAGLLLRLQRELFVVGAELATTPEARDRLEDGRTRVSAAMVADLDELLLRLESSITMPSEFVVPGETASSAAIEVARTIVRRAERRAVGLRRAGHVPGEHLLPYLNRLADLLWVLARAAEQAESRTATPSRPAVAAPATPRR
ncbi:MAG TPA: cob(I)yrinic acid a,c-diamide adenosyltransferase [Candidatus Limnocylindrales bacterium]|nr:cob(I)yrinic acid a,c-diamide adenosyltransferase [Candidatus Limnocylindrales bacterium]